MSGLIDGLLQLSRLSRQDVRRQKVDMSKIAEQVLTELREADPDRSVAADIKEGVEAFADAELLKSALANLLGNAWKFTSKTENARIAFGVYEEEGKAVYYVKDNGAGFDQTYAERMFLPFQRLHTEQEFQGTGIGLAPVERVVRRHGGKIWAHGSVNEGAEFFFTLG